jgi:hypothetical protein
MGWPVGFANPNVRCWTAPEGAVFAGGSQVTDDTGWLDVAAPMEVVARGGPTSVMVKLRLELDDSNDAFLFIDEVADDGGSLGSVPTLLATDGEAWLGLAAAVREEIAHRVAVATELAAAGRHSVRPPAHSTGQVWDSAVVEKVGPRR